MRDLQTLSLPGATPNALSDQGEIVGDVAAEARGSQDKAFLWKYGKPRYLSLPSGTTVNGATHRLATDPLLIVGDFRGIGFLWRNGNFFKVFMAGTGGTHLSAVNARGQAVGIVNLRTGHSHALLEQNGRATDLGTLSPRQDSVATAINDKGIIVGWATTAPNSEMHAVLWTDGVIQDLNDEIGANQGIILESAEGINNHNQIICNGFPADEDNNQHAYLLMPR